MTTHPEFTSPTPSGRLRCTVCPRFCELKDRQRGFCFVRQRQGAEIVLTTYGRSSGFCIDPIEKKPLYHFLPGSPVLSFGTAGCNLSCQFCQNWSMSKSRKMDRLQDLADPEAIARAAAANACSSVAYTYNDPVIFLEYAVDTARVCQEYGIQNVSVTAGYITPEAAEYFFQHMQAANIDLKAFSEGFYRKLCSGSLRSVLDTLVYVKHETDVWLEITTLLIPEENDSDSELDELTGWISEHLGPDVPVHFSAFHPDYRLNHRPPTPMDSLTRAAGFARQNGLQHVYLGNVRSTEGSDTHCSACGHLLIRRRGYQLLDWNLLEGNCPECGAGCPGSFRAEPGNWGNRYLPISIHSYS